MTFVTVAITDRGGGVGVLRLLGTYGNNETLLSGVALLQV
jgi:hypothetical protein